MIKVMKFETLGHQNHGWLDARHHFSFAHYYDPRRRGYPPLRVWNDDTIKAGTGFPMHPHKDMEIITYIRKGAITHEDSLGNRGRTEAGNVQVMSAGKGIIHSEFNLENEDTTLFQIWIETAIPGVQPRWDTRQFPPKSHNRLEVLASGRDIHKETDALRIFQDAVLLAGTIESGKTITHTLEKDRFAYLVPAVGKLKINGKPFNARDGVVIKDEEIIAIETLDDTEIVLTDLVSV